MKLSLNWLKEYVTINISPEKLAHQLTMAGIEVKKIEILKQDVIFELEITPNRPDCLSVWGIAREISAFSAKALKIPKLPSIKFPKEKADVRILDRKGCLRYIGTVVQNVSVQESPTWLKAHLNAIGSRPINNIVDITNFSLLENGQPLHAFDYDKLTGGKIVVRRAERGEKIVTIDGLERALNPSVLVIADAERPVAIAGIMGGKATEVSEGTKNILLESAYFDPVLIRQAGRALGLGSDSSYRFERGVDMEGVAFGSHRALGLIVQHAGGSLRSTNDFFMTKEKFKSQKISISVNQINGLLGTSLPLSRCQSVLYGLGFKTKSAKRQVITVEVPTFRGDIKTEVDLIEEIARVTGYEYIPSTLPQVNVSGMKESQSWVLRNRIQESLMALGFDQVIAYTMTNQNDLEKTRLGGTKSLRIRNPLTQDQEFMRPAVLPGLISIATNNIHRGQKDFRLFETTKVYSPQGEEKEVLGILLNRGTHADWRFSQKEIIDFYDAKGVVEELLRHFGLKDLVFVQRDFPFLESGSAAEIFIHAQSLGLMGEIARDVLLRWDVKQKGIFFVEINLEKFYTLIPKKSSFRPIPEYPPSIRDISLAVPVHVSYEKVTGLIQKNGSECLTTLKFVEQYVGDKIPQGYRGLVFSLVYQSPERTLREEEVNIMHENIVQALTKELGAIRR